VETKINVRVFTVKLKVVVLLLVGLMTGLAACQGGQETPTETPADTTTTPADTTTSPSPELSPAESPSPEESPEESPSPEDSPTESPS
jgi:cytoskeletal protein RodZ